MADNLPEMTDLAFGLKGGLVPASYAFALWGEVARCLPWLEDDELAGILPLRAAASGSDMLLPQRAKLVLRLRAESAPLAMTLTGKELDIDGGILRVGEDMAQPLKPQPTLHAHLVEGNPEEGVFLAEMEAQLRDLQVACRMICGKRQVMENASLRIAGYSLALHGLTPAGSMHVLRAGLGGSRRYGCGIFVPHKNIPDYSRTSS